MLTVLLVGVALAVLLWPRTPAGWPARGVVSPGRARVEALRNVDGPGQEDWRWPIDGPLPGNERLPVDGRLPADRPGRRDSRQSRSPAWSGRRRSAQDEALVHVLSLLSAPVRAGVPPGRALQAARTTVRDGAWGALLGELVEQALHGAPLAPVWSRWGERLGSAELAFVGQAWGLSERTGAPLADALDSAVAVLEERRRSRERLAAAVAGPRASMAVLCLLPLSGPLVGLACGIGVRELYLGRPAAALSLVTGLVLAGFALWWSRRIVRGATGHAA